ncbi:MAG: heavy metal translocating P-type ATPase, partial [Methanomassiliicoccales archaeon]|nr:heavy metal translocating P-type ATPase [Methanomassiliicoccales archaeon]
MIMKSEHRHEEPVTKEKDEEKKKATLPVIGMTCATCAETIEHVLSELDGVESASVNLAAERATVIYDPKKIQIDDMKNVVKAAGYEIVLNDVTLSISGMTCATCAETIETALNRLEGVHSAVVNLASEKARIQYDPNLVRLSDIKKAIREAGYEVLEAETIDEEKLARQKEMKRQKNLLVFSLSLSIPTFLLTTILDFSLIRVTEEMMRIGNIV